MNKEQSAKIKQIASRAIEAVGGLTCAFALYTGCEIAYDPIDSCEFNTYEHLRLKVLDTSYNPISQEFRVQVHYDQLNQVAPDIYDKFKKAGGSVFQSGTTISMDRQTWTTESLTPDKHHDVQKMDAVLGSGNIALLNDVAAIASTQQSWLHKPHLSLMSAATISGYTQESLSILASDYTSDIGDDMVVVLEENFKDPVTGQMNKLVCVSTHDAPFWMGNAIERITAVFDGP